MRLRLESIIKLESGLHEVSVWIIEDFKMRKYVYLVPSEFQVRKFNALYKRGKRVHGKALALLNKHKIKKGE